jgi:hypothetical protein
MSLPPPAQPTSAIAARTHTIRMVVPMLEGRCRVNKFAAESSQSTVGM